jgi:hypothetical protein
MLAEDSHSVLDILYIYIYIKAFPAIIAKIAIKKVQLSNLVTVFSILFQIDSLFYSLYF